MNSLFLAPLYAGSKSTIECQINQTFSEANHSDSMLFFAVAGARKLYRPSLDDCSLISQSERERLLSNYSVTTNQVMNENGVLEFNIHYGSVSSGRVTTLKVVLFDSLAYVFGSFGANSNLIKAILEFNSFGETVAYMNYSQFTLILASQSKLVKIDADSTPESIDYSRFIEFLPQYDWKTSLIMEIMWTIRPLVSFFTIKPLKNIYGNSFSSPPNLPTNFVAVIDDPEFNLNEPTVARKFKFRADQDIETTLIEFNNLDESSPSYFTRAIESLIKGFKLFEERAPEILTLMKHQSRWQHLEPWTKHGELVVSVLVDGGLPDYSIVPLPAAYSSEPYPNYLWASQLKEFNEKYEGRIAVANMSFGRKFPEARTIIPSFMEGAVRDNPGILHVHSAGNDAANICSDLKLKSLFDLPNYIVVGSVNKDLGITFESNGSGSNYGCVHVATQAHDVRQFTTAVLAGQESEVVWPWGGTSSAAPKLSNTAYYMKLSTNLDVEDGALKNSILEKAIEIEGIKGLFEYGYVETY